MTKQCAWWHRQKRVTHGLCEDCRRKLEADSDDNGGPVDSSGSSNTAGRDSDSSSGAHRPDQSRVAHPDDAGWEDGPRAEEERT